MCPDTQDPCSRLRRMHFRRSHDKYPDKDRVSSQAIARHHAAILHLVQECLHARQGITSHHECCRFMLQKGHTQRMSTTLTPCNLKQQPAWRSASRSRYLERPATANSDALARPAHLAGPAAQDPRISRRLPGRTHWQAVRLLQASSVHCRPHAHAAKGGLAQPRVTVSTCMFPQKSVAHLVSKFLAHDGLERAHCINQPQLGGLTPRPGSPRPQLLLVAGGQSGAARITHRHLEAVVQVCQQLLQPLLLLRLHRPNQAACMHAAIILYSGWAAALAACKEQNLANNMATCNVQTP